MTVKEFKNTKVYKNAKNVRFVDINEVDITNKPEIILNLLPVIGSAHYPNGDLVVDVDCQVRKRSKKSKVDSVELKNA